MRRPSGSLLASIIVHAVVVSFFVQALVLDRPLFDVFDRSRVADAPERRIRFVTLPPQPGDGSGGPRRGAVPPAPRRPKPPAPPVQAPPVQAPSTVPTELPPAPPAREPAASGAPIEPSTGPLTGGNGNLLGLQPRFGDGRLWSQPGQIVTPPKTEIQRMDSAGRAVVGAINDSMATLGKQRAPGDWTFEKGGQKYGIDQRFIRLGPVSIPTAVLAMLPLNITANPTSTDRERRFNAMHDEIFANARRGMNEADFQKAVRALRLRKEKERKEKEEQDKSPAQKKAAGSPAASDPSSPPAP
jgi:hypothetical protein